MIAIPAALVEPGAARAGEDGKAGDGSAAAVGSETVTVAQVVAIALENRPELAKLEHQAKAIEAKKASIAIVPPPMVEAGTAVPFTDPLSFPEATIMISQGFPLSKEPQHMAEVEAKKAEAVKEMSRSDALMIAWEVADRYMAAASMQEEIDALRELEVQAVSMAGAAAIMSSSGMGDASMAALAGVEVEMLKGEREAMEEGLAAEKTMLAIMAGMDPDALAGVRLVLPAYEELVADPVSAMAQAVEASPGIAIIDAEIAAMKAEGKVAKDAFYPMMTISVGYSYKSNMLMGLMGKDAFMISAGITIPLWRKKYAAGVEAIEEGLTAMSFEKEVEAVGVKGEVAAAWAEIASIQAGHRALVGKVIPQANLAWELALAAYSTGGVDLAAVIDALGMLEEATRSKVEMEGDHARARARWYRALGVPPEDWWT